MPCFNGCSINITVGELLVLESELLHYFQRNVVFRLLAIFLSSFEAAFMALIINYKTFSETVCPCMVRCRCQMSFAIHLKEAVSRN